MKLEKRCQTMIGRNQRCRKIGFYRIINFKRKWFCDKHNSSYKRDYEAYHLMSDADFCKRWVANLHERLDDIRFYAERAAIEHSLRIIFRRKYRMGLDVAHKNREERLFKCYKDIFHIDQRGLIYNLQVKKKNKIKIKYSIIVRNVLFVFQISDDELLELIGKSRVILQKPLEPNEGWFEKGEITPPSDWLV